MNRYLKPLIIAVYVLSVIGCGKGEKFFEEERYQKMIFLNSDNNNIIHAEYVLSNESSASSELSLGVSGTNPIDKDETIEIEKNDKLFNPYNFNNFLEDVSKYARKLSDDQYQIASTTTSILSKTPSTSQIGLISIKLSEATLEKLSPDSTYFIPLGIKSTVQYPIIESKRYALYKIYKKNSYASQKVQTSYISSGTRNGAFMSLSKIVHPITFNSIRSYPGPLFYNRLDSYETIKRNAMKITVGVDNKVTLSPYWTGSGGLLIQMLTPSDDPNNPSYYYRNEYKPVEKAFYLYYRYSINNGASYDIVQEQLSLAKLM